MQRQDQRRIVGDPQRIGRDTCTPCSASRSDFRDQRMRIDHHAIADHRQFAGPHHAGRQQRELVAHAVDDQRMAGVVPALKADDDIGLLGEPIDNLALALVPPLGPDDDDIRHGINPSSAPRYRHCGRHGPRTCKTPETPGANAPDYSEPAWRWRLRNTAFSSYYRLSRVAPGD